MALSCLFKLLLTAMLVKLLTPEPPVHDQVVFHAIVEPLREVREAQSEPFWALDNPH